MPKELSRSHEGEDHRSDRAFRKRDTSSSNGGQVRDFAILPFQLHEEQCQAAEYQREGKAPAEGEDPFKGRAIGANDQRVERLVIPDKSGLKGGMKKLEDYL